MSAQKIALLTLTAAATAANTQHRFVGFDGAPAAAAGNALGVGVVDAEIGDDFGVDVLGTTVVEAGGAIADGGAIEVGADAKAVAQSAGVTVARALQEAAADGDLIEVLLIAN
ncbi:capsid cement protein [Alcanivorax sp.]|uniref:capsid cement protein n=1 Tax=Alcanivorax sp. TaxID=1872427 RepID=UPI000C11A787|nr:capsid cement protein [Alcanivorax sp.]PHR68497.1 MAG: DUF2190 domain-containing protein [Alcanivorax sp.]